MTTTQQRICTGVLVAVMLLSGFAPITQVGAEAADNPLQRRRPTPQRETTPEVADDEGYRDLILLLQSPNLETRVKAVAQLAKYRENPEVQDILKRTYITAVEWQDRAAVVKTMGAIRDEVFITEISRALLEDADYRVRQTAAEVMTDWVNPDAWRESLIQGISEEKDGRVTRRIVPAFEANGIDILAIADYSMRNRGKAIKELTADILTRLNDPRSIPTLADFVKDPDPDIRRKIVYALGSIGTKECVPHLIKAITDQDRETRQIALTSIGQIRSPLSTKALVQVMLTHFDMEMRREAATELGNVGARSALPELRSLVDHEDDNLRSRVITALGKIGDPSVIPVLKGIIESNQSLNDRVNAISAMGLIGGTEAIRVARDKLQNSDEAAIREISAFILGQLQDQGSVDLLISALKDESLYVNLAAVNALGLIGDPKAKAPLIARLEGRTPKELDDAVALAMQRIDGSE